MRAVVAAFNQEKALVGAFSVLTNLRMEFFQALYNTCCNVIFVPILINLSLVLLGGVTGGAEEGGQRDVGWVMQSICLVK